MIASLEPEVVFTGFGRVMLGSFDDADSLPAGMRRHIAVTPDELPADAEFVSGHIAPSATRARYPDADHVTVLREPRVRLLSAWLFARAHSDFNLRGWGDLAALTRAARSSLLDYMSNPLVAAHVDNCIARLLLWPHDLIRSDGFIDPAHDDELFEEAVAILDTFSHVGIVENPGFVADLGRWLGRPLALPRLNEVKARRESDPPDVATEVLGSGADLLRWRTRIDARLWSHVAARAPVAAPIDELRDRTFREAVERYSSLVRTPVRISYPRRIIERTYAVATRVRTSAPATRTGAPATRTRARETATDAPVVARRSLPGADVVDHEPPGEWGAGAGSVWAVAQSQMQQDEKGLVERLGSD